MKTDVNRQLQQIAKDWQYVQLIKVKTGWTIDCKNVDIDSRSIVSAFGKGKTPLQAIKQIK